MPVDHFCLRVSHSQLEPIVEFIIKALEPLGVKEIMRPVPTAVGLGDGAPWLWFTAVEGHEEAFKIALKGTHVAFTAENGEQVRQFHAAALKAGATCNGEPGIRNTHPGYYAAFVLDPVFGINFEVVCHKGDK